MAFFKVYGSKKYNDIVCSFGGYTIELKGIDILGWFVLSYLFPLVGLILGLIWKDSKPYWSKACLKGVLYIVIVDILYFILYFCIFSRLV